MRSPSAGSRKPEGGVTLVDRLLGRRLATWEGEQEKLSALSGVPAE
jgi:hypothetical protein